MINNKNTIVTAVTSDYKEFLYVFLESIKTKLKGEYEIIFIHNNLKSDIVSKIEGIANGYFSTSFYNIANCLNKTWGDVLSKPIYWRLAAPYTTDTTGLLLYLDVDVMSRKDFSEIFSYDLKGKTIGACTDYLQKIHIGINNWKALRLDPKKPYFNAGVLLIDIAKFKANNIAERVRNVVIKNKEYLVAGGKWPQYDQYGLNVTLYDDWTMLPQYYNYGSELTFQPAKIVHFMGNGKPSSTTCTSEYRKEYFDYLKKLDIYDTKQ